MAENIQIPISGITTTSAYDEGSTYSLVNLRPKYGALHPVAPRKIVQELSQKYDIVFVHQNNDYQNWLGMINSDSFSSVYWDIRNENPENITCNIQGDINSVQQIGNTISLITEDNIYYLFYQNGRYVFLGEIPQIPKISFGIHTQTHIGHYFANEYGEGTVNPENFIDSTIGLVNKSMEILMYGGTDKDGNPIGGFGLQLFDACFIRYAFRLYDDTLTKHSPPILVMPKRHIVGKEEEGNMESIKTISYDFDSALRNGSKVDVYGHKIYMRYNLDTLGGDDYRIWKDIIKSVDVFMSPPIGISNIENIRKDLPTSNSPRTLNYNLIKGLSAEALKNAVNTSNFYFVRSLDLGSITGFEPDVLPSKESDFTRMENLMGDIKTTFFRGFHPGYFQWENSYNEMDPSEEKVDYIVAEIEIHTGTSLEKVYSFFSEYFPVSKLFASAFLSYPDPRAKRMNIYEVTNNVWIRVFTAPLEPHSFLNLAYFLNDGLKPIVGSNQGPFTAPDTSKIITRLEPNKIKVSDLDNPLRFPNINTYQVGNGSILAMASNAIRISEGQFGQFPLYVFTTQGIYSMDVGSGEVVYSNKSAPTSYEVPTTSIVASTPFGVVFTSARGICIISGQEVEFLTPQLQQSPQKLNLDFVEQMNGVIHNFEKYNYP